MLRAITCAVGSFFQQPANTTPLTLDLEALSSKPKAAISVISSKMLFISSSYAVDTTSTWAISTAGKSILLP